MTATDVSRPRIYHEQVGEGVPVLLIHPSGATASTWGEFRDELAATNRVITYDRRGYARTGGEPVRSIATHTSDAAALLDELGVSGVVALGTSIGATIAIDLARLRPDLVRAVVAHESPWHITRQPPSRAQVAALLKMNGLAARRRYPEAAATFLRFAYSYRDGGSAWDRFPDEWLKAVAENAQASLVDIRAAIGGYPSTKQMASVTVPVACSCGTRSKTAMLRNTERLSKVMPTATFHELDGAGHAAPFDAPTEFVKLVAEVIAGS